MYKAHTICHQFMIYGVVIDKIQAFAYFFFRLVFFFFSVFAVFTACAKRTRYVMDVQLCELK